MMQEHKIRQRRKRHHTSDVKGEEHRDDDVKEESESSDGRSAPRADRPVAQEIGKGRKRDQDTESK